MTSRITGKVYFKDNVLDHIPSGSFLVVSLQDVSLMDAPSVLLGSSVIDAHQNYHDNKGRWLSYTIDFRMPENPYGRYSLSAVLNIGWRASGDDWIREGDYKDVGNTSVRLYNKPSNVTINMEISKYDSPTVTTKLSGKVFFNERPKSPIPPRWLLTVQLRDVSRMDAASILIGSTAVDAAENFQENDRKCFTYSMSFTMPMNTNGRFAVSALLHPAKDIENAAFRNTTQFIVPLSTGGRQFNKDLEITETWVGSPVRLSGKIGFKDAAPSTLHKKLQLLVLLQDDESVDGSPDTVGSNMVNAAANYRENGGRYLSYDISFRPPWDPPSSYSLSASIGNNYLLGGDNTFGDKGYVTEKPERVDISDESQLNKDLQLIPFEKPKVTKTLSGKVLFKGGPPEQIEQKWFLSVDLKDISDMDEEPITLGSAVLDAYQNFHENTRKHLTYSLKYTLPENPTGKYVLSALLAPGNRSGNLTQGYKTVAPVLVDLNQPGTASTKNLEVIRFDKTPVTKHVSGKVYIKDYSADDMPRMPFLEVKLQDISNIDNEPELLGSASTSASNVIKNYFGTYLRYGFKFEMPENPNGTYVLSAVIKSGLKAVPYGWLGDGEYRSKYQFLIDITQGGKYLAEDIQVSKYKKARMTIYGHLSFADKEPWHIPMGFELKVTLNDISHALGGAVRKVAETVIDAHDAHHETRGKGINYKLEFDAPSNERRAVYNLSALLSSREPTSPFDFDNIGQYTTAKRYDWSPVDHKIMYEKDMELKKRIMVPY